MSTNKNA